jgi:hypothetical protein
VHPSISLCSSLFLLDAGCCKLMPAGCRVSMEDMYNGTTKRIALRKKVLCDGCEG